MAEQWYVERNAKKFGPYPMERLKALVEKGRLLATDMLLKEGETMWVAASAVDGLFVARAVPPPIPKRVSGKSSLQTNPVAWVQGQFRTNPQQALLTAGGAALALLLVVCVGCVGVVSQMSKPSRPENGRRDGEAIVQCGRQVMTQAKIGASPQRIKTLMTAKAKEAGIDRLEPTHEEEDVVQGRKVLNVKYEGVRFSFIRDRSGQWGLLGGSIDGKTALPGGDLR